MYPRIAPIKGILAMDRGLRYLVVKPTLFCTAACPICALRRDLFSRKLGHQPLSSDEWVGVIRDAHALGCSDLRVSGGEPTLYPGLAALVGAASDLGMHTGVNTNGSALSPELLESLLVAGLDSVTVSIYSHDPSKHDLMRREPGLFRRAVHALRRAADMSGLEVNINTVLTRANLLEFDKILELALQLGADSLHVSYLEGDMEKKWLPRVGMIRTFRAEVIPRAEAVLREHLRKFQATNVHRIKTETHEDEHIGALECFVSLFKSIGRFDFLLIDDPNISCGATRIITCRV